MTELNWSQWSYMQNQGEMIPQIPGTYQIRWAINGVPQPIPRFNGVDDSGLLYIGETDNLNRRIRRFHRCVTINPEGREIKNFHSGAVTFVVFRFDRRVNPEDLQFRYLELPENETRNWELRLLTEYIVRYLDKPPLNTSIKR